MIPRGDVSRSASGRSMSAPIGCGSAALWSSVPRPPTSGRPGREVRGGPEELPSRARSPAGQAGTSARGSHHPRPDDQCAFHGWLDSFQLGPEILLRMPSASARSATEFLLARNSLSMARASSCCSRERARRTAPSMSRVERHSRLSSFPKNPSTTSSPGARTMARLSAPGLRLKARMLILTHEISAAARGS